MLNARVLGTATSTVKHPSLEGWRLLVVQPIQSDGERPDGDPLLAVDHHGASRGDEVMLSSDGRYTRALLQCDTTPVRWTVLGIRD